MKTENDHIQELSRRLVEGRRDGVEQHEVIREYIAEQGWPPSSITAAIMVEKAQRRASRLVRQESETNAGAPQ